LAIWNCPFLLDQLGFVYEERAVVLQIAGGHLAPPLLLVARSSEVGLATMQTTGTYRAS